MREPSIDEELEPILARDPRYRKDAYLFVRDAVDFTKTIAGERQEGAHVTGQELLSGIRTYALSQFGPMVITVLEDCGVSRCEDFGEIVFNMVEAGLLFKTDTDKREHFHGGYTFEEAFRHPFLPGNKLPKDVKTNV